MDEPVVICIFCNFCGFDRGLPPLYAVFANFKCKFFAYCFFLNKFDEEFANGVLPEPKLKKLLMFKLSFTRGGSLLACCLLFFFSGHGQEPAASIHGTVKSTTGSSVIAGATVALAAPGDRHQYRCRGKFFAPHPCRQGGRAHPAAGLFHRLSNPRDRPGATSDAAYRSAGDR